MPTARENLSNVGSLPLGGGFNVGSLPLGGGFGRG